MLWKGNVLATDALEVANALKIGQAIFVASEYVRGANANLGVIQFKNLGVCRIINNIEEKCECKEGYDGEICDILLCDNSRKCPDTCNIYK